MAFHLQPAVALIAGILILLIPRLLNFIVAIYLIVIGVTPTIILDTFNLTKSVPPEQIVKGFTLGTHDFGVSYAIVLKQMLPRTADRR